MLLIKFTHSIYCQGDYDKYVDTVLVPEAASLEEAKELIIKSKRWERPRDFENMTVHPQPKPSPKCGHDGWGRQDNCEYDDNGVCIHCGEEIPF